MDYHPVVAEQYIQAHTVFDKSQVVRLTENRGVDFITGKCKRTISNAYITYINTQDHHHQEKLRQADHR